MVLIGLRHLFQLSQIRLFLRRLLWWSEIFHLSLLIDLDATRVMQIFFCIFFNSGLYLILIVQFLWQVYKAYC